MGSFIKSTGTGISGTLAFLGNRQNVKEAKNAQGIERQYVEQGAEEMRDARDLTLADYQPYASTSPTSLAMLQSAVYGGPQSVSYQDPNTKTLTAQEWAAEKWKQIQAGQATARQDVIDDINIRKEDPIARIMREEALMSEYQSRDWYKGDNGIADSPKMLTATATYQPQESEGFKYTKERTLADLGRSLRMMGRGSGTTAANATGRTLGDLNALNEQQQYNRLGDLVTLGQFGTQGKANANFTTGMNLGALYGKLGNTQAAGQRYIGDTRNKFWADQAKWNYQGASDSADGFNEYMSMKNGGMGGGGFGG